MKDKKTDMVTVYIVQSILKSSLEISSGPCGSNERVFISQNRFAFLSPPGHYKLIGWDFGINLSPKRC